MLGGDSIAVWREGCPEGTLIPANLSVLSSLVGTRFLPQLAGVILVLEEIGEPPHRCDRMMTQLRLSGALDGLAGLVFGQFTDCIPRGGDSLEGEIEELLRKHAEEIGVPAIARFPYGHEPLFRPLPVGVRARIVCDPPGIDVLEAAGAARPVRRSSPPLRAGSLAQERRVGMKTHARIGILTGGGDVPGLNSAIRAFTLRAVDDGHEVLGIRRGWGGLIEIDPANPSGPSILPLDRDRVRTVDRHGGTFLHTSRTNPAKLKRSEMPAHLASLYGPGDGPVDATDRVLKVLTALRLDALVAIGGDDTLSYAVRLNREGFPVIAIPKTMDNDVPGTEYCIGFSTAVTRSVNFLIDLRTPTGSHERIAVVELFGRYCGETALFTGFLGSADRTVISEVPCDIDRLARYLAADQDGNPSHYAILVISEGAVLEGGDRVQSGKPDAYGHMKLGGIGDIVGAEIERITGRQTLVQRLAYLMRSGPPDSVDRLVATNFANLAYDRIKGGHQGEMVALRKGCYTVVGIDTAISGKRTVDVDAYYDRETYKPRMLDVFGLPMFLT